MDRYERMQDILDRGFKDIADYIASIVYDKEREEVRDFALKEIEAMVRDIQDDYGSTQRCRHEHIDYIKPAFCRDCDTYL